MRPVVYSASSVNTYLACHLQWWFSYVMVAEGPTTEPQEVGIGIHDYAERRLRKQEVVARNATEAKLAGVFERDILPTYRDPVLIEAPFEIEVNGIPYSGVIDSVDRQDVPPLPEVDWDSAGRDLIVPPGPAYALILRDLKSTGSRPGAGKYRFNLIGYDLGATDLGYRIDYYQLDWIVRTKVPYYWPEAQPPADEDEIAGWAATLEGVANGVERQDFEPTGLGTWACKACPHAARCGPYQRYKEITGAE